MFTLILHTLFLIILAYFALSVLYLFILALWGRLFYKRRAVIQSTPQKRIAIMVPAYKEDGVILSTASSLRNLNYPSELYDAYIIADSFQPETLEQLRRLPINVIEVSFDKSTKAKALNQAFARIKKTYDIALICDADNILAKNFMQLVNNAFVQGASVVQGRRVAKNLDTSFSVLDACSEGINNNIFRKGTNAVGLASAVIGSGMAFEYDTIREIMSGIHDSVAEDRIVQLELTHRRIHILYLDNALIFDEKVDNPHAFQQQRKRWVSSQFIYLKQYFGEAVRQLFKGNMSYFNLAVLNNLVLPRAFLFLVLPVLFLASLPFGGTTAIAAAVVFAVYMVTMFLALPPELINKDLGAAIMRMPRAIALMIGTLFNMKKSNKTFIHTVHTRTEVTNPLFNEQNQ